MNFALKRVTVMTFEEGPGFSFFSFFSFFILLARVNTVSDQLVLS